MPPEPVPPLLYSDLRVCRASRSTVEITLSGATWRAIRHRPSVPSLPSAGLYVLPRDQRQQAQRVRGLCLSRSGRPRRGEPLRQHYQRVIDQVR